MGTSKSNVEEAGLVLKRLKRRLKALEERHALDEREQNRRAISRVGVKDVYVPILKSTEVEENRRWKENLLWWSEGTQTSLDMQAPHVIKIGITNAELNEVVMKIDRDEAQTKSGITKIIDLLLDEYLTPNPFLKMAQTLETDVRKVRSKIGMRT